MCVWRAGGERNNMQDFGEETEGKRPLERPGHRCEGDTKIDVKVFGWEDIGYIERAQLGASGVFFFFFVNTVINLQVA